MTHEGRGLPYRASSNGIKASIYSLVGMPEPSSPQAQVRLLSRDAAYINLEPRFQFHKALSDRNVAKLNKLNGSRYSYRARGTEREACGYSHPYADFS